MVVMMPPHGSGALCVNESFQGSRSLPETRGGVPQGPAVQVVRRHSRSSDAFRYAPAMTTVSGNYVAARRMGVVDGVDFGLTGMVRPRQGVAGTKCDAVQCSKDTDAPHMGEVQPLGACTRTSSVGNAAPHK